MKMLKLLMAICISSILLMTFAFSQTADTKKPAPVIKPQTSPEGVKTESAVVKQAGDTKIPQKPAQRKTGVPDIPLTNARIAFEHTSFDFGSVPPGAKVTHHFPVRNDGPDTLIISQIKAG
jgi:hypothetical protein